MNYITTTQLRTDTPELVQALLNGFSVDLIHRSKVVGTITPNKYEGKVFTQDDAQNLRGLAKKLKLKYLTDEQREAKYKSHLLNKYGKTVS